MSLCIIAIFKNEQHIMKEWIEHYLRQGVDKFFMIDNGSDDNFLEYLNPYIETNIVELILDKEKHAQTKCYNKYFLEKSKQYEWAIVCDLDEFIYSRKEFKTIKDYLFTLDNSISQVNIPWKIFGSNGFNTMDKEQPVNVVESFTKRINYEKMDGFQGVIKKENEKFSFCKCIVRTCYLKQFDIHCHQTYNDNHITTYGNREDIHENGCFAKINENILEKSCLHLNHYAIQSLKWFIKVKATRGDATRNSLDMVRDATYFYNFDAVSNDIYDLELCNNYIID